jgi:hypothetical protein
VAGKDVIIRDEHLPPASRRQYQAALFGGSMAEATRATGEPAVMPDTGGQDGLERFVGQVVVLDTQGPLIFIGTLERATGGTLLLVDADVHDTNDSRASKDLYVVETRDLGVRVNRRAAVVMRHQVASVSLLREVVD